HPLEPGPQRAPGELASAGIGGHERDPDHRGHRRERAGRLPAQGEHSLEGFYPYLGFRKKPTSKVNARAGKPVAGMVVAPEADPMADRTFEELLADGASAPVDGWDFSWFQGRASEQRPAWGYSRLLTARQSRAG